MRTWDIVDKLEPGLQITTVKRNPSPLVGSLCTAAVNAAIVLTVALAASGSKFVRNTEFACVGTSVQAKKANQSVPSKAALRGVERDTDTQVGQSSSKLARSFPAFFQPAPDEDQNDDDDDYSFA